MLLRSLGMSDEASDDGSDTETETVSEIGDGLLSVILSGSSCNLDECANNVITTHHELIIKTIDLQSIVEFMNKHGAITDAVKAVLSDESQPLTSRKEFLLTHVIKDKGVDGLNLLMGALKSCQHDPNQVELGEKLYAAMQQTFSSSDTSREVSPMSSVRDEWMSAYESATDEPSSINTMTSPVTNDTNDNDHTSLLPSVATGDTNQSSTVTYRKKKVI